MSNHNPSPENQFKPGESGNPKGRPVGSYSIMTLLRQRMNEVPLGQTKEWREQFADIILDEAIIKRNPQMLKMVAEYMDGMPEQFIDLTTKGEKLSINDTQFGQLIGAAKARADNDKSSA